MSDFWLWDDHERDDHRDYSTQRVEWHVDDLLHTLHVGALLQVAHDFIGHEANAAASTRGLGLAAAEATTSMSGPRAHVRTCRRLRGDIQGPAKAYVVRSFAYSTIKSAVRLIGRNSGVHHRLETAYERRQALTAEVREFFKFDSLRVLPAYVRELPTTKKRESGGQAALFFARRDAVFCAARSLASLSR